MAMISVQVPDHLAALLAPLDGKLALDDYWIGAVTRDAVDQLCGEVQALDSSATGSQLHSIAARLEQFADVIDEIEDRPRRIHAEINALAGVA